MFLAGVVWNEPLGGREGGRRRGVFIVIHVVVLGPSYLASLHSWYRAMRALPARHFCMRRGGIPSASFGSMVWCRAGHKKGCKCVEGNEIGFPIDTCLQGDNFSVLAPSTRSSSAIVSFRLSWPTLPNFVVSFSEHTYLPLVSRPSLLPVPAKC